MKESVGQEMKLQNLLQFFRQYGPVSKQVATYLQKNIRVVFVKKSEILIQPGSSNENLYFVVKGVIRGYITEGNKEITTWINEEDEIVGTIRNFGTDLPSIEIVQALEDSDLIVLPIAVIDSLYDHFPETNRIGRLIISESYKDAEERAYIARIPSAEERYRRFLHYRGGLINRISLKYIASYLNMNLETLSRIRSRKVQ